MTNKTTNKPPFKVKCTDIKSPYLTVGKEYDVADGIDGFYKVKNDNGKLQWYYDSRFQIVETPPKDKQEFSVGDMVTINKISDDFVSDVDDSVKVGDIATVTMIESRGKYDVRLTNPNWERGWWFSKSDVSLANGILSHQEVIQAILDGKDVEIQYTDGTWHSFSTHSTTLHQFIKLNFRLKPSLENKRKAVIKKLLTTKVAVLCKCWDDDDDGTNAIEAITRIDDDYTYPYMNSNGGYKNAIAIDDSGNEITNM